MLESYIHRLYNLERISALGYTQSNTYDPFRFRNAKKGRYPNRSNDHCKTMLAPYLTNLDSLGPFELQLLADLAPPSKNTVTALLGGRGSGKTATLQFLTQFCRQNGKDTSALARPFVLYLDCNSEPGIQENSPDEAVRMIAQNSAERLLHMLGTEYWDDLSHFLGRHKEDSPEDLPITVARLVRSLRIKNIIGHKDKILQALDYHLERQRDYWKLRLPLELAACLWRQQPRRFSFIVLDNADYYSLFVQNKLLQDLLIITNNSNIPLVLPMRLITYDRQTNIGQHIQRTISHSGVSPLQEVGRRTVSAIQDSGAIFSFLGSMRPKEKAAMLLRIAGFARLLEKKSAQPLIRAVSGYSVERGLSLASRAFQDNTVISDLQPLLDGTLVDSILEIASDTTTENFYSKMHALREITHSLRERNGMPKSKEYHYIHLLLEHCALSSEDYKPILENIFEDPATGGFSTIKLRILRWLSKKKNGRRLTVQIIVDNCRKLAFSSPSILEAFNALHDPEKRLIWCPGSNQFRDFTHLEENAGFEVGVTVAGRAYAEHLCADFDYVTFCLAQLTDEPEQLLDTDLTDRVTFGIRLLYEAAQREAENTKKIKTLDSDASPEFALIASERFLFAKTVAKATEQAIGILSGHWRSITKPSPTKPPQKDSPAAQRFREEVGKCLDKHNGYSSTLANSPWKLPYGFGLVEKRWSRLERLVWGRRSRSHDF